MSWEMGDFLFLLILGFLDKANPIVLASDCQPIGPYQHPLAVIPSLTDRYLVISASMHIRDENSNKSICGDRLNLDALLIIEAFLYAKDTFNVRMIHQSIDPLGLMIMDNCGDLDRTVQDLINFESCTLAFAPQPSIGGPIVFPDDAAFYLILDYKSGAELTVDSLDRKLRDIDHKPIFRLSDHDEVPDRLITALVLVIRQLNYKNLAVLFSDHVSGRRRLSIFTNRTESMEICVRSYAYTGSESINDTLRSISIDQNVHVLVLLTDSDHTESILKSAKRMDLLRRWHWLGFCASLKRIRESDDQLLAPGSVMLARENDLTDFYEYINAERDVQNSPWASTRNPWLQEYSTKIDCNRSDCDQSILERFQDNQWLQYNDLITEIVSVYDAASISWTDQNQLASIVENLRQSSLSSIMILNYRHTSKGWRFVRVGTVRQGSDIHLQSGSVQTYISHEIDTCPDTCEYCAFKRTPDQENRSADDRSSANPDPGPDFLHRTDLWACLLTGFAASMILMIFIYETYAVTRICNRLPRVSAVAQSGIFLSQGLLYGVFLQSISVFSITVASNFYICAIQRFLPGISCVLSYSVIFAKLLVLISAKQGQYLAACYQALVVVLFLAMQTIVSIHWLASRPLDDFRLTNFLDSSNDTGLFVVSLSNYSKYEHGCNLNFVDYLKMLILPFCLLILCTLTSILTRKNPYNYKETWFIALASFGNALIWATWVCFGVFFKKDGFEDAALGYALLTNAFMLTVIMFLPSSRQKTAMGVGIGLNPEDIMGLKNHNQPNASWSRFLVGDSKHPSVHVQTPKKKNAATQSTVRQSKRHSQLEYPSVHWMNMHKAMSEVNKNMTGTRDTVLDPGGSAVTLDVPTSVPTVHLPPPPPPMAFFNWRTQFMRPCALQSQSKKQMVTKECPQELYSSYAASTVGETTQKQMPKPVFPVLTPARMVNDQMSNGTINSINHTTTADVSKL